MAPLKEKASDLETRLRETETRLEEFRNEYQKSESQKSPMEAVLRELREREPQMKEALQQAAAKFVEEKISGVDVSTANHHGDQPSMPDRNEIKKPDARTRKTF